MPRKCPNCGWTAPPRKPLTCRRCFGPRAANKTYCDPCRAIRFDQKRIEWAIKNRDKLREYQRIYQAKRRTNKKGEQNAGSPEV